MQWTAHNVRLGDEWAFGKPDVGAAELLSARLVQLASDLFGPLETLRVLDLACLEGLYGLEFAMQGSEVVAIEGRHTNAERVRFAADKLKPERYEVQVGDVRSLSPETHGTFDLTLCLGILYHLEGEEVIDLARAVAACSTRAAVFRTAVGLSTREEVNGYRGFRYPEPETAWSSIGNKTSFWPTRSSLLNLLTDCGFTSVLEFAGPPIMEVDGSDDSTCVLALKGPVHELRATPPAAMETYRKGRWPERVNVPIHPVQRSRFARLSTARFWQKKMRRA